jgi:hypothetical protein
VSSPIVVAIFVFLSIYLIFLLIRLLSDLVIVGVALASAVLAYHIKGHYSDFLPILRELPFLDVLGINFPDQPEVATIYVIASLIIAGAVLVCLPFLPFSATYRIMLGVEKPLFSEETKVRGWIREEIDRNSRYESELAANERTENGQEPG